MSSREGGEEPDPSESSQASSESSPEPGASASEEGADSLEVEATLALPGRSPARSEPAATRGEDADDDSPEATLVIAEQTLALECTESGESKARAGERTQVVSEDSSEATLALDQAEAPAFEGERTEVAREPEEEATLAVDEESGEQTELFARSGTASPPTRLVTRVVEPLPMGMADGCPQIQDVSIEGVLGRGGQGTVYSGRQTYLDRAVAVKVLEGGSGSSFAMRFRREAKILAGMQHPNIVSCYQAGLDELGQGFIVMEFIAGPDLSHWIKEHGPLDCRHALALTRDIAIALAYAHEASVIHRDVKPQNVLLQPLDGAPAGAFPFRAKLADLGLARMQENEIDITVPGSVMGTPATMALEQFDDPEAVDFRADIYGLGCVLYHCLAGKSAYGGRPMSTIFKQKATEPPPGLRASVPSVPASVDALAARMMAAKPDERHQSYAELIAALEEQLEALERVDPQAPSSKRPRLAYALIGVAAAAALAYLFTRPEDEPTPPGEVPVAAVPAEAKTSATGQREAPNEEAPQPLDAQTGGSADEGPGSLEPPQPVVAALAPEQPPALAAGEGQALLEPWPEGADFPEGWTTSGEEATWTHIDDEVVAEPNSLQFRGTSGRATRALPSGSWQLNGLLSAKRPYGADASEAARCVLRLEFESGFALQLQLDHGKPEAHATWTHLRLDTQEPSALGASVTMPEVRLDPMVYLPFSIESVDGELLLQLADQPVWKLPPALRDLDAGPPTRLTLIGSNSVARWRALELSGL